MNQEEIKALIKEHLENGKISKIYRNTYYSLLDRVEPNGCYPESVRPECLPHLIGNNPSV